MKYFVSIVSTRCHPYPHNIANDPPTDISVVLPSSCVFFAIKNGMKKGMPFMLKYYSICFYCIFHTSVITTLYNVFEIKYFVRLQTIHILRYVFSVISYQSWWRNVFPFIWRIIILIWVVWSFLCIVESNPDEVSSYDWFSLVCFVACSLCNNKCYQLVLSGMSSM